MRTGAEQEIPAVTPAALALLLGVTSTLCVADQSLAASGSVASWVVLWCGGALLALLVSLRPLAPTAPGPWPGLAWLVAGAAGGAVFARHLLDSFIEAVPNFAFSAPFFLSLRQGEAALLAVVVLAGVPLGIAHRLRSRRPAVLLVACLAGVAVLGLLLSAGAPRRLPSFEHTQAAAVRGALWLPASILWTAALVGPASMPLRGGGWLVTRVAPRLALLLGVATVPLWLASLGVRLRIGDGPVAMLSLLGARSLGVYGGPSAAGIEAGVSLVAMMVVLLLAARVAARSLPGLRSGIIPALGVVSVLLVSWLPLSALLRCSLVVGWIAWSLGTEQDPPAEEEMGSL